MLSADRPGGQSALSRCYIADRDFLLEQQTLPEGPNHGPELIPHPAVGPSAVEVLAPSSAVHPADLPRCCGLAGGPGGESAD